MDNDIRTDGQIDPNYSKDTLLKTLKLGIIIFITSLIGLFMLGNLIETDPSDILKP